MVNFDSVPNPRTPNSSLVDGLVSKMKNKGEQIPFFSFLAFGEIFSCDRMFYQILDKQINVGWVRVPKLKD